MKNPAGVECAYFYGDYYRGRNREECRLLSTANPPLPWEPQLCEGCPVPAILRANSCQHQQLRPSIMRPFPFFKKQVRISAYCSKTHQDVAEPMIGCGECHPLPEIFLGE